MTNDHEERFRQHEDILRSLTAMLAAQHAMNQRVEGFMQRQVEINAGVQTTLARIETLLDRLLHPGGNGQEP